MKYLLQTLPPQHLKYLLSGPRQEKLSEPRSGVRLASSANPGPRSPHGRVKPSLGALDFLQVGAGLGLAWGCPSAGLLADLGGFLVFE